MACTCKSVHFEFQFWSFWAKARIFISFLENKGLYPFSKPVLRTLVTVQSILAGCIRRATFLESLMSLWCMSRISTAPKVHLAFLLGKMVKALLPFILSKTLSTKMTKIMLWLRSFVFVHLTEVLGLWGDRVILLEYEGRGNNRVLESSSGTFFCWLFQEHSTLPLSLQEHIGVKGKQLKTYT